MAKIIKRIKAWFGYHNGTVNIYAGRFDQGLGFDVNADSFEIRRFGIRIIKDVKINVDPQWLDNLKKRLSDDKQKQR